MLFTNTDSWIVFFFSFLWEANQNKASLVLSSRAQSASRPRDRRTGSRTASLHNQIRELETFPSTSCERPVRSVISLPKVQDRLAACVMENELSKGYCKYSQSTRQRFICRDFWHLWWIIFRRRPSLGITLRFEKQTLFSYTVVSHRPKLQLAEHNTTDIYE